MGSMDTEIADVLNGKHMKTSAQVTELIERVKNEIPKVEKERTTFEEDASNPVIVGDDTKAARQKAVATEFQLKRLKRAVYALLEYRDKLIVIERDERQKADHAAWLKDRTTCEREMQEFFDWLIRGADLLHRAVDNDKAGQRFFRRPTPGTPTNPMDDMVSEYERLPPLISDQMKSAMCLVSEDGTVLFKHIETKPSSMPAKGLSPKKLENFAHEKECLRQARERQTFARTVIRGIEREAEARNINFEQAAVVTGHVGEDLPALQDQADGKQVTEAMAALKKAHGAILNERQNPTT